MNWTIKKNNDTLEKKIHGSTKLDRKGAAKLD